jgi:hypothetical protein
LLLKNPYKEILFLIRGMDGYLLSKRLKVHPKHGKMEKINNK